MKTQRIKIACLAALFATAACGVVESTDPDLDDVADTDAGIDEADGADAPLLAPVDGDSLQSPAASHFLSITGERQLSYTDEVSFPGGDAEDFVEFELPNNSNPSQLINVVLDCTITGDIDAAVRVDIFEDGAFDGTLTAFCDHGEQGLTVNNTAVQTARIAITGVAAPTHVEYTLTVIGFQ